MAIDAFKGQYAFLSNFYPSPLVYERVSYPTVEHAFQAAKSVRPGTRRYIAGVRSPAAARQFGRTIQLRPGWDGMRLAVMDELLHQKFGSPDMRRSLLATHPHLLEEHNGWGDTFWGVYQGRGHNHLGRLLMQLRGEWR